jgi:Effector-associated domain 1
MTGAQVRALRDALCEAFTPETLRQMLRTELDRRLEVLTPPGDFQAVVFDLIEAADREGWAEDLVRGARRANPNNPALLRFCAEHPSGAFGSGSSWSPAAPRGGVISVEVPGGTRTDVPSSPRIDSTLRSPERARQAAIGEDYCRRAAESLAQSNSGLRNHFLDARCRRREFLPVSPAAEEPAAEVALAAAGSDGAAGGRVVFLGDFGTGKTCLCEQAFLTLSLRYLQDVAHCAVPILVRLSKFKEALGAAGDPRDVAARLVLGELKRFRSQCVEGDALDILGPGGLILLLDGLDEMPAGGNLDDVRRCLAFVRGLAAGGEKPNCVILTSRTVFFATRAEELRLDGFAVYELCPWGPVEWGESLRLYGIEGRRDELERIHDVAGLYTKPYFVKLILKHADPLIRMADERAGRGAGRIRSTDLYDLFVSQTLADHFGRDQMPPRVTEEEHRRLLRLLAIRMLNDYQMTATRDQFVHAAREVVPAAFTDGDEADVARDLIVGSLLHRTVDGSYEFPHLSILEYLAAEALADATARGDFEPYSKRLFYVEVFAFAAPLHRTHEHVRRLLGYLRSPQNDNVLTNLLTLVRNVLEGYRLPDDQAEEYRQLLLGFLFLREERYLQVRYAAAFSLWRCSPTAETVSRIAEAYRNDPYPLVRRVLWHTLEHFRSLAPESFAAVDVPPSPESDAFEGAVAKRYLDSHPSAVASMLAISLVGAADPVEHGAYWIVQIGAAIGLTSYGEEKVLPALFRDLTAPQPELRANAALCLENFCRYHAASRDRVLDGVRAFLDRTPSAGGRERSRLEALLKKFRSAPSGDAGAA